MSNSMLKGTYRIVSVEFCSGGDTIFPFGKKPEGWIMYDGERRMSVQMADSERPTPSAFEVAQLNAEELKSVAETFLSYYGVYEVDEKQGIVTHALEGGFFPGTKGAKLIRKYWIKGRQLILEPEAEVHDGKEITAKLTWEKLL